MNFSNTYDIMLCIFDIYLTYNNSTVSHSSKPRAINTH